MKTAVSEAVTNCIIHGYENEIHTIRLTAALDGAWLTVTVEDDGVGIPDIEKAMEPMYTTKPRWIAPAWLFLYGSLYGRAACGVRAGAGHIGTNEKENRQ